MANFDSAWCLQKFNELAGRPTTDAILDATKYRWLSEAQQNVVTDAVPIVPNPFYPTGTIPSLTLSSDQKTATFGTDGNGYAKYPMNAQIFQSLNDIPTNPLVKGVDYLDEGTQIRALNNTTLPGTLYVYGAFQPPDITALVDPILKPEGSRELIPIRAAYNFGLQGNRNPTLSQTMAALYGYPLAQASGRFAFWCLSWKTAEKGSAFGNVTGRSIAVNGWGNYQWST